MTFLPLGPTSLQGIIPAYVYSQYADDDNIQAFNTAYNAIAQNYLAWFNSVNLPIYTGTPIAGPLLDWVAEGIYGIARPSLPYGFVETVGPINTWTPNQIVINGTQVLGAVSDFSTSDDVFKRIITWYFFKGDGQQVTTEWLKRRVMRFLLGSAGAAPNVDQTYPVSISFGLNNIVTIGITLTTTAGITLAIAQTFQAAVQAGAVALPYQHSFTVTITNNLATTNLTNVAGALHVAGGAGYPTSATGLVAGAVWSNSGAVKVVSGVTPNPFAAPLFFGVVTAAQLQVLGGGNLPLANPGVGSMQLWNSSGSVLIA